MGKNQGANFNIGQQEKRTKHSYLRRLGGERLGNANCETQREAHDTLNGTRKLLLLGFLFFLSSRTVYSFLFHFIIRPHSLSKMSALWMDEVFVFCGGDAVS